MQRLPVALLVFKLTFSARPDCAEDLLLGFLSHLPCRAWLRFCFLGFLTHLPGRTMLRICFLGYLTHLPGWRMLRICFCGSLEVLTGSSKISFLCFKDPECLHPKAIEFQALPLGANDQFGKIVRYITPQLL
jgi:hypothetical protein